MFKYRGILPVIIIVMGLGVYAYTKFSGSEVTFIDEKYFEFICLGVALFGAVVRAYTVGYTPYNTSGRNIDSQVADTVNTIGIYSIVRHPLYVGNFFCSLGIAMLTQNLWFVLFFIAAYWLYYERIMQGIGGLALAVKVEQARPAQLEGLLARQQGQLAAQAVLGLAVGVDRLTRQVFVQRARLHAVLEAGAGHQDMWQAGAHQGLDHSSAPRGRSPEAWRRGVSSRRGRRRAAPRPRRASGRGRP